MSAANAVLLGNGAARCWIVMVVHDGVHYGAIHLLRIITKAMVKPLVDRMPKRGDRCLIYLSMAQKSEFHRILQSAPHD